MAFFINKNYPLPDTYIITLSKENDHVAESIIKILNTNTDLDKRIKKAQKAIWPYRQASPLIICKILSKYKIQKIDELSEQKVLTKIAREVGKTIIDCNVEHWQGDYDRKKYDNPLYEPDNIVTKFNIDDVLHQYKMIEKVAAILIFLENKMISSLSDVKEILKLRDVLSGNERFTIALSFLQNTFELYPCVEIVRAFNSPALSPIQYLELERHLVKKGALPKLEVYPEKEKNWDMDILLKRLELVLPGEKFSEKDPLDISTLKLEGFLKRITLPSDELYLLVGLISDNTVLLNIANDLGSLLVNEKEAIPDITIKIAAELCSLFNERKMSSEEFFTIIKACLKHEALSLKGRSRIITFIQDNLKYPGQIDSLVFGLIELGLTTKKIDALLDKLASHEPHELIKAFCIDKGLATLSRDRKISLIKKILKNHTLTVPQLVLNQIDSMGFTRAEKATFAKDILKKITNYKSIQDNDSLSKLISVLDKSDLEELLEYYEKKGDDTLRFSTFIKQKLEEISPLTTNLDVPVY